MKNMLKRAIDESHEMHQQRINFAQEMSKRHPDMQFDEIETMSFIWKNITFFGMYYSSKVVKQLNAYSDHHSAVALTPK